MKKISQVIDLISWKTIWDLNSDFFIPRANYKTLPMKMLGRGFIKNPASDEKNADFEMNPPGYNNYSLELDNELAARKMNNNNNNSINSKENEAERITEWCCFHKM